MCIHADDDDNDNDGNDNVVMFTFHSNERSTHYMFA